MSTEVITVILTAAGLVVTLGRITLASTAWIIRQMDEQFDKMDERFKDVGTQFSELERNSTMSKSL